MLIVSPITSDNDAFYHRANALIAARCNFVPKTQMPRYGMRMNGLQLMMLHMWHWNLGSDSTMTMTTREHACHLGTLANVTSIFRCARARVLPQFVFFLLLHEYKPVPRFVRASFIPLEYRPMTEKYRRWRDGNRGSFFELWIIYWIWMFSCEGCNDPSRFRGPGGTGNRFGSFFNSSRRVLRYINDIHRAR